MARKDRIKENYNRLRAAGFSAADARKLRYHSQENINKAITEKVELIQKISKKEKTRDNYNRLRAAGFSAADARRYRNASAANIEKALKKGIIPPKKKRIPRPKVFNKDYKASSIKSIELFDMSEKSMQQALRFIKSNSAEYPFVSIVVTITYATGQVITFSSPMTPTRDFETIEDIEEMIEDLMEEYIDKYGLESSEPPLMTIAINLWKPNPGASTK